MIARWWPRVAAFVVVLVGVLVALTLMDFEPRLLETSLLVGALFGVGWLVADTLVTESADWGGAPAEPVVPAGRDRLLATYDRVLEGHLTAREPGPALRDRLVALAQARDPDLSDPVLRALAEDPAHRMARAEIDEVLRRIEQA